METIYLVIPRWFYPQNLGDSVHWSFAPTLLKKEYPDSKLVVITVGELVDIMRDNPLVDEIANPNENLIGTYDFWKQEANNGRKNLPENMFVLFAERHPRCWDYWNDNFDYLYKHPTANLLYLNSVLQLGLEKYLHDGTDLFPKIFIEKPPVEEKTLAIVPAQKITPTNPTAHPGCDGKGFRFNGDQGGSWREFVDEIKRLDPDIKIMEFSKDFLNFGDVHVGHMPWKDLAYEAAKPRVTVLADGGMHHIFNSQDKDIVLLAAQTINKLYHYASKNTTLYWDLHSKCTLRCGEQMKKLRGWEDLSATCDTSCETVDPVKLAQYTYRDFFHEK
jgi:hypothetical protein